MVSPFVTIAAYRSPLVLSTRHQPSDRDGLRGREAAVGPSIVVTTSRPSVARLRDRGRVRRGAGKMTALVLIAEVAMLAFVLTLLGWF